MGQQDIIEALEKGKKWMTINEVARKVDMNRSNVARLLRILADRGDIMRKEFNLPDYFRKTQLRYRAK